LSSSEAFNKIANQKMAAEPNFAAVTIFDIFLGHKYYQNLGRLDWRNFFG
jgi:hypothetical protein